MTKTNQPLTDNPQSLIEDLTVNEEQSTEVKGGEQRRSSIIVAMGDASMRH